jgi:hypothetical protein
MTDINRPKAVEDFICDYLDAVFNDSIKLQKEFDASKECRSISIASFGRPADDQHTMLKGSIDYNGCRTKRSDAIADIDKIQKNFNIYNKYVTDGLVISIVLVYITSPMRTIVDSHYGWTYTATFEVTTT